MSRFVATSPVFFALLFAWLNANAATEAATGMGPRGEFQLQATLSELLGSSAQSVSRVYPPDEPVSWEVFVPQSYDPERPPGLLVYISPGYTGEIPAGWARVLEAHNLIWVSANKSGNSVHVQRRALFALLAPTLMRRDYRIDAERIYVTGLSGGGKMASMVATDHAHVFKGAIYNCGVEFWDTHPPSRFDEIKRNRFVFVTGEYDQALRPTKRVYGRYKKAGVQGIKLMVIPDMGHENPQPRELAKAIEFLDG